jgi:hypothetical protein
MELTSFEKASLYTALHTYLSWLAGGEGEPPVEILNLFESLGVVLPRKASGETAEYVRGFRAGVCRTDLNPAARASLPNHPSSLLQHGGILHGRACRQHPHHDSLRSPPRNRHIHSTHQRRWKRRKAGAPPPQIPQHTPHTHSDALQTHRRRERGRRHRGDYTTRRRGHAVTSPHG